MRTPQEQVERLLTEVTPHPYYVSPTRAQVEAAMASGAESWDTLVTLLNKREEAIRMEKKDPWNWGVLDLSHWNDARELLKKYNRLLISGGNRSGKSMFASRNVMETLVDKPNANVVCFSMTDKTSIRDQQPSVYNWLPLEWKFMRKGRTQGINFSIKNGFTDSNFVCPNGSRCWFMHYSQQEDILEGYECDLIWFDELVPYELLKTADFRVVTRAGKILVTATPITGWTNTVNEFQSGCRIVRSRKANLLAPDRIHVHGCGPGEMPYIAECLREDSAVIWFHTDLNPYQPEKEMRRVLQDANSVMTKIRYYGYTEKTLGCWFPKLSKVHVVKPEAIPEDGTNYMVVDPAGQRNWFMLWLRVDKSGKMFVYREWPSLEEYGEWAVPSTKPEGALGPAASSMGFGLKDYETVICEKETRDGKREEIIDRLIDRRAASTPTATSDGGEDLRQVIERTTSLAFTLAPALHIEDGISQINSLLSWNEDEPLSVINEPKLFISERCGNLLQCMANVSSAAADKNKWKDPVDCLRYLITAQPSYVSDGLAAVAGGGFY